MADPRFRISEADSNTELWRILKAHFESRIAALRVRNDRLTLSHDESIQIRARIAELKNLVTLDQPAPPIEADEP